MRLVDIHNVEWRDRVHFFAVSAQLMRRILVDSACAHGAIKAVVRRAASTTSTLIRSPLPIRSVRRS
jgi:hypothetical protein